MSTDKEKYYEPLKLMTPIRYQYMKKIILNKKNASMDDVFIGKNILDIGTGTGEYLDIFKDLKANCIGIDSINNFKIKKNKNFKLIKVDLFQYLRKAPKNHFDFIFCFEVIEHLEEKDEIFKLIKKTLKDKGILFMSTINQNPVSKLFAIKLAEDILKILPKKTHEYNLLLPINKLESLCNDNKLSIIDITGLRYNPLFKNFNFSNNQLINYITAIEN
ncbi:MAG: bifunctional 2-polyprenyl-6-hydroxyphenol methylase/3-demethylubiquinol 3-O-methyltransferase UbiG [Alphaproteobacteria bacterium]|jgi:2-polyprenyl-6-hydroxyphenyl methylase/3-demethylubiquinone-9 3-methyltransferase